MKDNKAGSNARNTKKKPTPHPGRLSRRMIIVCAVAVLVIFGAVTLFFVLRGGDADEQKQENAASTGIDESLLHGEAVSAEQFVGEWVTYSDGKKVVCSIDDDGCWLIRYPDADPVDYHYEVQDDRVVRTLGDKKKVFIWDRRATDFIAEHESGEVNHLLSLAAEEIEGFSGYMYVQGDYLYVGKSVFCRTDRMSGFSNTSLAGSWTGAAGDRVTFTADGGYHYRQTGYDYDGSYALDEATGHLSLKLEGTNDVVLKEDEWAVSGRYLFLGSLVFFRDVEE